MENTGPKQTIWTQHHRVSWDDTSPAGTLSLTGLNILLQRAAVEHAEHLGFGFQVMSRQNLSWVLVKAKIEIFRFPEWREKIKLVTWPSEMARLSAFREYVIYAEETNEILCNASSEWLLIDLKTRRPQKMDNHRHFEKYATKNKAINRDLPKYKRNCNFSDLFSLKTRYSSLDMNGHTNARKYIDWLDDAIHIVHGDINISLMQISYFQECTYGEEIVIQHCNDHPEIFRGWKPKTEQVAFLARVESQGSGK